MHYAEFVDTAVNATYLDEPVTDKVTSHGYETMYANLLLPLRDRLANAGRRMKILEIGLGCDMGSGKPGASALLWSRLLPTAERWMAELDGACVNRLGEERLKAHVLIGDQANATVLKQWVARTGGGFDVIVDDGGHANHQIVTSLEVLWPRALRPGGLYFIEDLHVSRADQRRWQTRAQHRQAVDFTVSDMLASWSDQLLSDRTTFPHADTVANRRAHEANRLMRRPHDLEFVFVQRDAAALGKLSRAGRVATRLHRQIPDIGGGPLRDGAQRAAAAALALAYRTEAAAGAARPLSSLNAPGVNRDQ